jgi:hypothetical protein
LEWHPGNVSTNVNVKKNKWKKDLPPRVVLEEKKKKKKTYVFHGTPRPF